MPSRDARMHYRNRENTKHGLAARMSNTEAESLLTLADTFGSVVIPVFAGSNDAWGMHYGLTLQNVKGEYIVTIEGRPHW